jgi:aspartate/methionine/tyrosine aminotransferase
VVVTSGASEAIFLAFSVLGKRNAIVPVPNYEPMLSVPRWLGMRVGHSLEAPVHQGAVYALTDPNNPTGARLRSATIDRLGEISKKASVFVNETYGGFTFDEPVTLHSRLGGVVTCSSMTKFYGLGRLRVGWMIADARTAKALRKGKKLVSGHDAEYSLWLARQVLERRAPFVERARLTYTENAALVRKFARRGLGVSAVLPEAAPFCLFRYKGGQRSVAFAKALLERRGVLVGPGDFFGAPSSFRLCFTSPKDVLEAGLEELAAFLGDRAGG